MKGRLSPTYRSLLVLFLFGSCAFGIPRTLALDVTLAWNANPEEDVAGYRLYYGTPAGNFGTMVDVGNVTQYQLSGLDVTRSYSFRLTCYNTAGLESDPSAAVQYLPGGVNQAPTANPLYPTTQEDNSINITLSGSDPESSPLTFSVVTQPTRGSLLGTPPNLTFHPGTNYFGYDSFTYTANDGQLDSAPATVGITVQTVNDAPQADPASITSPANSVVAITLSGSDVEASPLTYTVLTFPTKGSLSGIGPNLIYIPAPDYSGPDAFTFQVNDGSLDSAPATVSLTVQFINSAPVAQNQSVTVDEDVPRAIPLFAVDVNGDPLTFTVLTGPTHGTLSGAPPNLIYIPNFDYSGADSFTFYASDPFSDSAIATVSLTILPVNDTPKAAPNSIITFVNRAVVVTLSGSDIEASTLTYAVLTLPINGTLSGTAPDLIYTPAQNFSGADFFTFQVNDGSLDSPPATVSLTVLSNNTAPVAQNQIVTVDEDFPGAIALTAIDADSDPLIYAIVAQPTQGTLSGSPPNLTYTPNLDFHGSDFFTFRASDGQIDSLPATVGITVNPVNDAPMASPASLTLSANSAVAITLSGTDAEGTPLTYAALSQPMRGILTGTPPHLTYIPNLDESGFDSFTFKVNDGSLDSAPATISLTILGNNTAPIAQNQALSASEDVPRAITLAAIDADGDPLTYAIVAQPANGTLSGSPPDITYTPNLDYNGTDSFTFLASDPFTSSAIATVSITIRVNDSPFAFDSFAILGEDLTAAVLLWGFDPESGPLTYHVVSQPLFGSLSGTPPRFTYTAGTPFYGVDRFTFKVNDGSQDSNEAEVWIRDVRIAQPEPPLLITTISTPGEPDTALLSVAPVPGLEIQLQRSINFGPWTPIFTNQIGTGLSFQDSSGSPQSVVFYRTLLHYAGP